VSGGTFLLLGDYEPFPGSRLRIHRFFAPRHFVGGDAGGARKTLVLILIALTFRAGRGDQGARAVGAGIRLSLEEAPSCQ
jgi:hypothetical protein